MAGQRARARERHRAPGRDRPARTPIEVDDLPPEIRAQDDVALRPKRERRRTVADDLYKRLIEQRESFWTTVYPLFMEREITRANVREVVRHGPRGGARQLQDRGAPVQHGIARLQAVPEFPAETRLPDPFKEYR